MSNPAELLHRLLQSWAGPINVSADSTRKLPTSDGWEVERRAVSWLEDIRNLLEFAETEHGLNLSHARRHFDKWTAMVFAYPNGWRSAGNHSIDLASLEQLEATATTLQTIVPTFTETGPEDFGRFLSVLRHKVENEDEFFRTHVNRIINHLEGLLNDWEHVGEFRITQAMADLELILEELRKRHTDDSFFKNAATHVWGFFRKDVAAALLAGMTLNALPSPAEANALISEHVKELTAADTADDVSEASSE